VLDLTLVTFQRYLPIKAPTQLSIQLKILTLNSYDENGDPVMLLAIPREKFVRICDKFPDSKRVLIEKAWKRRKQFKINKTKSLVKLMKVLVNNFESGFKKIASLDENYL
jgi:hypothetical protein